MSTRLTSNRRLVAAVAVVVSVIPAGAAMASGDSPRGCQGLYEVARFATYSQVGDTHGHETVHHQLELHGCEHAH